MVYMVVVAQLAEHRVVVPKVVGSSPIYHPYFYDNVGREGNSKNMNFFMFFESRALEEE